MIRRVGPLAHKVELAGAEVPPREDEEEALELGEVLGEEVVLHLGKVDGKQSCWPSHPQLWAKEK